MPDERLDSDGNRADWEIVTIAENGESKPVLQPDPDLYPDLVAAGSLAAAVIRAAERAGLDLNVCSPVEGRERLICASISTPRGRFGINIGAVERWFITSLWSDGVELTGGRYLVSGPLRGTVIGEADDSAGAVALVVAGLPVGCGPAVVGTAEDLQW
jgi:hypothetical protein